MTLPASGPISFSQLATEIGTSLPLTMPSADLRTLAGKPTGALILPDDFWGKSWKSFAFIGTADGTGVSISGVSFGAAASSRRLVAVIQFSGNGPANPTVSSVTIGGVAATVHVQRSNRHTGLGTTIAVAIASAIVPNGTSGTVSWSIDTGTAGTSRVGIFRVIDDFAGVSVDSDTANESTQPATLSLTTVNGGKAIAASAKFGPSNISQSGLNSSAYNTANWSCRYSNPTNAETVNLSASWGAGDEGMAFCGIEWTS